MFGLRTNTALIPLAARGSLILLCAGTAALIGLIRYDDRGVPPSQAILPAMLLLCVAALASLPMPDAVPRIVPTVAETLTAAVIVGALGRSGVLFLLYLLVPVFTAGLTAGFSGGVACAVVASVTLLATSQASGQAAASAVGAQDTSLEPSALASWIFIFLGVGLIGAWIKRIRTELAPDSEPAYADAHRLLSELHVVARQLSLGLDPRTLAAALVDDIRTVSPHAECVVLARSPGGRFVALVGAEPEGPAEEVIESAWTSARPVRRRPGDTDVAAVPVSMGERVVAMLVMTTPTTLDDATLARCESLIEQAGPRLASAMLFDDVRRLATVDERMRLAREIHDGIAQDVASLGYALDGIRQDAQDAAASDVAARVADVREQLRTMVADLRMSIFDLRTGVDDSIGLGTALGEYAQRVGAQSDLVIHLSVDESPRRLPIATEVELLRIVQEAITNVRRHAQARNLWLTVTVEPPKAHVTVIDDGRGLGRGRPDSFGITGMRERARRIGAALSVGPGPEGGTMVEVALGDVVPTRPRTLPRSLVSRQALTDPRGIPALAPPTTAVPVLRADQEVNQ